MLCKEEKDGTDTARYAWGDDPSREDTRHAFPGPIDLLDADGCGGGAYKTTYQRMGSRNRKPKACGHSEE